MRTARGQCWERLQRSRMPTYDKGEVIVELDDTFVGFTDGIVEATGDQEEFLGEDRLEALGADQSCYAAHGYYPATPSNTG